MTWTNTISTWEQSTDGYSDQQKWRNAKSRATKQKKNSLAIVITNILAIFVILNTQLTLLINEYYSVYKNTA